MTRKKIDNTIHKCTLAKGGNMKRLSMFITDEQFRKLKYVHADYGKCISDSVREAIDEWIEKYKPKKYFDIPEKEIIKHRRSKEDD